MKSLRRTSYGIIDRIRLINLGSQSKSSNQSSNGNAHALAQRDSREELQNINAQLSADNALLRRQMAEKERKLTEKDRTIGTDGSSCSLSISLSFFCTLATETASYLDATTWNTCLNELIGIDNLQPCFNTRELVDWTNATTDSLKEHYEKEVKAREETIQRLQDIIDKSIGGYVSLSRPAAADRSSYYEGVSPTTPTVHKPDLQLLSRYDCAVKQRV